MRILASLLFLGLSCASASSTIRVCNDLEQTLNLAFAYETPGGWISDGWMVVAPNSCEIDSKHPDVTSFFYHATSGPIKTKDGKISTWTWGSNRAFSIPAEGFKDFKYERAEYKAKGAKFAEFNGPDSFKKPTTLVTLSFKPDLSVTFATPKEDNK